MKIGSVGTRRRPGDSLEPSTRVKQRFRTSWRAIGPWLSIVFLILIIVIPLGLFIWFVFFTATFTVQSVTVLDARDHTIEATKRITENALQDVSLQQSIFFVQTDLIEQEILGQLPHVRTAHVTRQLPGTIKIVIQEKEPVLLLFSGGDYFFVDGAGLPYEEAKLETLPGVILPTVKNNDAEATVTLGVPAVDEPFVAFVQYVQEELPAVLGVEVAEIRIPSLAAREVHFRLTNNWLIRFDSTREPAGQLDVLQRIVNEVITEEDRQILEYIDLRIKDRVYYKTILST